MQKKPQTEVNQRPQKHTIDNDGGVLSTNSRDNSHGRSDGHRSGSPHTTNSIPSCTGPEIKTGYGRHPVLPVSSVQAAPVLDASTPEPGRVNIVIADQGWILERCAREIESRLSYVTVQTRPDPRADLNYYVNYSAYQEPQPTIEIGFFTHIEERDKQAARRFFSVARKMNVCVCMSPLYADRLREAGVKAVRVITPGVDLEAYQPKVRIGVVGRTYPTGRKGEDLIAKLIDEPGIEWHFTGSGWPGPATNYAPEEMPSFYNSVDYILVSSYYEGGPMTVLEALACGKPVIAPPIGFIPSHPHLEYRTGDVEDLRRVLREIVVQRWQLRQSVAHLSWDAWACAHDGLFRSVMTPSRPSRKSGKSSSLKVLMALHAPENLSKGGPSIRIQKTALHLRKLGIQADITTADRPDPTGYDLVHVFNVWEPRAALDQLQHLKKFPIPIVLSPIYLNLSETAWASLAIPAIFSQSESPEALEARLEQIVSGDWATDNITRYGDNEIVPGYHAMVKQIVGLSNHLIALSNYEMEHLWKLGIAPRAFTLVPNGADPHQFQSATGELFANTYGIKDYVLCIGRIEVRKNQLMLSHALRDLDIPLVFIGNCFEPQYLKLLHQFSGPRTIFVEYLPNDSALLASAYAGARVFALPSWSEGAPLTALEAAAAGCPLVLGDRSGIREYFGDLATYCDPGNVADIRRSVRKAYYGKRQQSSRHAQRLKDLIRKNYNWSSAAEATAQAYREALASFKKQRAPETSDSPRKLEIGSGMNPQPGYEHLDVRSDLPHIDHVHDINRPLPFPEATFDEILSRSCLEHISWRQIANLLRDWRRVLKPGGKLEIWMPDFEYLCRMYLQGQTDQHLDPEYIAIAREKLGTYSPATWAMIKMFAGQDYPENFHTAVYDFETFASILRLAGFEGVERIPPYHGLHVVAHRPLADSPSLNKPGFATETGLDRHYPSDEDGAVQKPISITWAESIFSFSGYSRLSRQTVLSLHHLHIPIAVRAFAREKAFINQLDAHQLVTWKRLLQRSVEKNVYVCFHPPTLWDGSDVFAFNRRQNPGFEAYVGITMFETDRLPAKWAESCNIMDEIWVPSTFNKKTFIFSGVDERKLHVIPFGIDTEAYDPGKTTAMDIAGKRGFTFLSVFQWTARKGWDILLKAYLSAFSSSDDVCLVLRTYPFSPKDEPIRKQIDNFAASLGHDPNNIPPIILIDDFIPEKDLPALYATADAFVLPTRGEGWGIPFMEAMAMGLPTIATRWSAHLDYMDDANSYLINVEKMVHIPTNQTRVNPFYTSDQQWAEPCWKHTAELMRKVYDHRRQAREKGFLARRHIQSEWRIDRTAQWIACRTDKLMRAKTTRGSAPSKRIPAPKATCKPIDLNHGTGSAYPHLLWHAPIYNHSGYADEARHFLEQLHRFGFPISAHEIGKGSSGFRKRLGCEQREILDRLLSQKSRPPFINVVHFPAYAFERLADATFNIGRTMFETDSLPAEWVEKCNRMDEVWVPSDFNLDTFRNAGVKTPLRKVPGGIDTERFQPGLKPLEIVPHRKTVFLSMFEWIFRKGWDVLLDAWAEAFHPDDDVCLVLRTYPLDTATGTDPKQAIEKRIDFYLKTRHKKTRAQIAPIVILGEHIGESKLPHFFAAGDAYVSCSRGEGWGRPQMQAMSCGLPVIATHWGGNLEFMNGENSFLLDTEGLTTIDDRMEIPFYRGQKWAEPSREHLVELLQGIYRNPKHAGQIGKRARKDMVARWGWEEVAQIPAQRLKEIHARPPSGSLVSIYRQRPIVVKWEGSQLANHSLALVNRALCFELSKRTDVELSIISRGTQEFSADQDPDRLEPIQRRINKPIGRPADFHVRHQWPPDFAPPAEGHWIMIQPWEFGRLPADWIEPLNTLVDEIWVPSNYVRQVYIQSGIPGERVFVVPNGVDFDRFSSQAPKFSLKSQKKFKFLFVGGTIWRKGIDVLLEAYTEAFSARDDVCLVIKDIGTQGIYKRQAAVSRIAEIQETPDAPQIEYLDENMTDRDIAGLYTACNALVHPYRGEGFALPVAEAMACGLPVIVTAGGACDDFCCEKTAYFITASRQPVQIDQCTLAGQGWILEPDKRRLVNLLRHVYHHQDEADKIGSSAATAIRQRLGWDKSAQIIVDRMRALQDTPIRRLSNDRGHVVPEPARRYQEARKLLEKGDHAGAKQALYNLTVDFPEFALAHNDLGILYHGSGETEKALSCYRRAVEIDPLNSVFQKNLADYYCVVLGEVEQAMEIYVNILRHDPQDVEALLAMGHICRMLDREDDAVDFYRRVLEVDGENETALASLVSPDQRNSENEPPLDADSAYRKLLEEMETDTPETAIAKITTFLSAFPDLARAHSDLATLYQRTGDSAAAERHLRRAVDLEPENGAIQKNLADFYLVEQNRKQEALDIYARLVEKHPCDEVLLLMAGHLSVAVERLDDARSYYERLLTLNPDHQDARAGIDGIQRRQASTPAIRASQDENARTCHAGIGEAEDEGNRPQISILLPAAGPLKQLRRCLEAIAHHTPECHEVILVDTGISQGSVKWLKNHLEQNRHYRKVSCKRGTSRAAALNLGIAASRGEFILALTSDVEVTAGWLTALLAHFRHVPDIGVLGAMSNVAAARQTTPLAWHSESGKLNAFAETYFQRHRYRRIPVDTVDSFCMLMRRSLLDAIGTFDEGVGEGGYEAEDICLRAALHGRQNYVAGDVYLHRRVNKQARRSSKQFDLKWSGADDRRPEGKRHLALLARHKALRAWQAEHIDEAGELYLEAIGLVPDDPRSYLSLAEMLIQTRQFREALEVIEEMPAKDSDTSALALAAKCHHGLDNYKKADRLAAAALRIDPGNAAACDLRGILSHARNDGQGAKGWFERAREADPGYADAYTHLAALQWEAGDQAAAVTLFERGFVLSPARYEVATAYHQALSERQDWRRARVVIQEAAAAYPYSKKIRYMEIDVLLRLQEDSEAMGAIESAMADFGVEDGMLSAALKVRATLASQQETADSDLVSLCMIVKNEEKVLAKCLSSVKPVVDEIVVVDTGSSDHTPDIARAFGARVDTFAWDGDFAAARNRSLELARGRVIFVMDADEALSAQQHSLFRRLSRRALRRRQAFIVNTRNYTFDGNQINWTANEGHFGALEAGTGWTPSAKVRIFPKLPAVRYEFPVHEIVEHSLERAGIAIKPCDLQIHHYGKLDRRKNRQKDEIYYDIGRRKLAQTGDIPIALKELAVQATSLQKHSEAVELWERYLAVKQDDPQAYINLGISFCMLGDFTAVRQAAEKALRLKPGLKEGHYNHALAQLHLGRPREALERLEKLCRRMPEYLPARFLLAAAHCAVGDGDAAQSILKELSRTAIGPGLSIRCSELARGLMNSGRVEFARALVDAAIESGLDSGDLVSLQSECLIRDESRHPKTGTYE